MLGIILTASIGFAVAAMIAHAVLTVVEQRHAKLRRARDRRRRAQDRRWRRQRHAERAADAARIGRMLVGVGRN